MKFPDLHPLQKEVPSVSCSLNIALWNSIDNEFNGKVSDFGLAKLLGSDKSHVVTRVMGTFGYVTPEYTNTGMLNEKSDVYGFGIVLLETVTGRDPVDYSNPANEDMAGTLPVKQKQKLREELTFVLPNRSTLTDLITSHLKQISAFTDVFRPTNNYEPTTNVEGQQMVSQQEGFDSGGKRRF